MPGGGLTVFEILGDRCSFGNVLVGLSPKEGWVGLR